MLTSRNGCGCGCGHGDLACAELPPEFVRVRYYYGQRLGVMELNDEAAYHAGKHAFHNARLHGIGVVCGLRAERYVTTVPGAATTVLRVRRGVALDACGREVVVGVDQCIDVAAWFARNRTRPALSGWTANTTQQLTVALRYRECPSDPAIAPRDPCGCDNGGCELARIREGFELTLLTPAETRCATQIFPDPAALASAIAGGGPADRLNDAVAGLVSADCPEPATDAWLCLSTVDVMLDGNAAPADLGAIDNAPAGRATLLATSALQSIVLGLALSASDTGAGLSGPSPTDLAFAAGATPADGTLTLGLALLASGSPPVPDAIAPSTFNTSFVSLSRFETAGKWTDVTAAIVAAVNAPPNAAITVAITGQVVLNRPYRLTIDQPLATPIADVQGRPLQPPGDVEASSSALPGWSSVCAGVSGCCR